MHITWSKGSTVEVEDGMPKQLYAIFLKSCLHIHAVQVLAGVILVTPVADSSDSSISVA
ncbi:hypothetical protein Pyn_12666 [Prunus yedoensis var. nudiflora]|uniref:Uncharacterized protein n=1 Tax=Prunus yedoensis var. nudiflora TaxID=2094558 RepID=A0A314ZB37_PRUYE|nr:hypothetical protein Pyn_12666 [Prunus yedoensis var. nudiflora]